MSQVISDSRMVQRIAGLELNTLLYSAGLPVDVFQNARIARTATPIYDINGEVLFYRISVRRGRTKIGYADIAANSAFGEPLISISHGSTWGPQDLLQQAANNLQKQRQDLSFTQARFVSYSFPKIAVQFLYKNEEVLMLELGSWQPVPVIRQRDKGEPVSNFERWSLIEETPEDRHNENLSKYRNRISNWDEICPPLPDPITTKPIDQLEFHPEILDVIEFESFVVKKQRPAIMIRELHYSQDDSDHSVCFELRGQLTSVWCVAASVQMLLDFYRYNYEQTRIADDLGLGTLINPNPLPFANIGDVVTVMENLTSNALTVNMNTNPSWNEFVSEIDKNRPLISFITGHSRTVTGYISVRLFNWFEFDGLLVYDPWPPNSGVITRWENINNETYTVTYASQLTLV